MDQLAPNTIIGIILAVFAVLGFLKNFVKFFFNLISLAVGGVAGLWGYNNGLPLARKVVADPQPWMAITIGVVCFVVAVCFVRMILGFLSGKSSEDSQAKTGGRGIPGGIFGLLIGIGTAYFMLSGARYAGTLSELSRIKDYLGGKIGEDSETSALAKVKEWINNSQIGKWHEKIDFFNDPARDQLAKLALIRENQEKMEQLAPEKSTSDVLEAIPVDDDTRRQFESGDFSSLLKNKDLRGKNLNAAVKEALLRIDIERALGIKK